MIILTPNRRLTAFSLQQFNVQRLSTNNKSWITPDIFPIETWLHELWTLCLDQNLASFRPLLNTKQQHLLFEQIIQRDSGENELLRVNATAQNAVQAWKFLKQWQVNLRNVAAYADFNIDTAAFYRWLQAYLLWLDEQQYFDFHLMVDCLINLVPEITNLLPTKICMRGFNEFTPQYAALFAQFAANGVEIISDQLTAPGASVVKSGFENAKFELHAAASWAQECLDVNEEQSIGIVIPNLEQQREFVHNTLGIAFPNGWVNISAPLPLAKYDFIGSALQILHLAEPIVEYNALSVLLRSPFILSNYFAHNQGALLDRMLRERVEAKVEWQKILNLLPEDAIEIRSCIINFSAEFSELRGKHEAHYWVVQLQKLLQIWSWPGDSLTAASGWQKKYIDQDINSKEMDLLTCWSALLEEYCKLSVVLPKHSYTECLQFIRRLATEIPFLPSETGLTKIHVLGLLEAEGLAFDHLWICGMSREAWPPAANPNPFIPLELQREFDLPHSSAQRELLMAQKYTANLQQGARKSVVFSYPKLVDDYTMQPSNLLAHLPEVEMKFKHASMQFIPDPLEIWQDIMAPAFTEAYVGGGAGSLRLQAQCPFKANAEIRLKAKPLEVPLTILDAAQRGSLVHAVLENFWQKCKSHAQLVTYAGAELEQVLQTIIQDILQVWQRELPFTLTNNYIMLEAHRLYKLIARWLDYETRREPFVVYQLEKKTLISIGPLQVNIMIDRIDQVDNNFVIIDYKTGETQMNHWYTEPIYDPQLPMYVVSASNNIVAVAFATLRPQDIKFTGIAEEDNILPNVKAMEGWRELQQDWRRKLATTAQEFVDGNAIVDPFSPQICSYCQLHALCRINEQQNG